MTVKIDAKESRRYLRHLRRKGFSQAVLAQVSGLSERHINQINSGRCKWVHQETEDRILGIALSDLRDAKAGKIGSAESVRLVNEILAAGWSKGWICRQLGYQSNTNLELRGRINASRARKIQELHDRLWWANATGGMQLGQGYRPGVPLRSVCKCFGVVEPKVQKARETKRRERERAREVAA